MFNNIIQPLMIYDSLEKQQVNESGFISTHNIFNYCPNNTLPPFIHYKTLNDNIIVYAVYEDGTETDVTKKIDLIEVQISIGSTVYYCTRHFGNTTNLTLNEGDYYLKLIAGAYTWYSEWFTVINNISDNLVKLEWWNTNDIFSNYYYLFQDSFKFRMWLPGFIKMNSEYDVFERIVTRFNNEQLKTYQKKAKIYTLISPINAFMGDCIELAEMCDNIWITNQKGENKQITITDIKFNEIDQTDIQELELKFKTDFIERGNIDSNAKYTVVYEQSGIFRGDKKLYRGGKKIVR